MNFKCLFCGALITLYVGVAEAVNYVPENISASISLKVPGNVAERYSLNLQQLGNNRSSYLLEASESIPVTITQRVADVNGKLRVNVCITALEDILVNGYQQAIAMMIVNFICRVSGIAGISVRLKMRLRSILQIVGWCVKTG